MTDEREKRIEEVRRIGRFDAIIVGGGINGIGVFRELALQGLKVLLVERGDFCSGCSAAPSRMIHGGLRYLENGEFSLVRESLLERDALLANAPHMVRPLATTIPITSVFSGLMNAAAGFFAGRGKPARRGALPVKLGLSLYDWVTRKNRVLPTHRFRNAAETFRIWPELTRELRYSASYHDAWISYPERLGIELILDARNPAAIALNYAEIAPTGDTFTITDTLTQSTAEISARLVINATGAWLDETARLLSSGSESRERLVSGTKGSHLIIDSPPLFKALGGHMMFFENTDGRVCIVFPYLGKVLAGSTDIRIEKPERVRCEDAERDYIIGALKLLFPRIAITPDDVVFSYSGIRPLPESDQAFTGRISRGHSTVRLEGAPPQLCMVGGKWTTFRAFAEQTADMALEELGVTRSRETRFLAIGGGAGMPAEPETLEAELVERFGIDRSRARHLVDLYGTRSRAVMKFCSARADDIALDDTTMITEAEIAFLIRHEFAARLSDLVLRRTPLAITGVLNDDHIEKITARAAAELGWSDQRRGGEVRDLLDELEAYYGVTRTMLERRTQRRRNQ
ncbi:glycerol-3-phosphate dehydrogenase/oxidase [Martelella soudanensis]|uniref:glycerol-3-phosphate dehydrogenase/oxidase n=1 Tax=unclassified Martelella TaxID=2629616 RepID=UPI0015DEFF62|nr:MULTISPECIES: glycerol-3-phosphate dehydrogenase/oxidase [unclassified Martelella]